MARNATKSKARWMKSIRFRAAGAMALALAGLGAVGWGVAVVHARAMDILAAEPTTLEISWPTLPGDADTWMGPALQARVTAMIEARLAGRPLDASALADVGEMLAASGWFDTEPLVRRTGDGSIGVRGVWREPACVLRSGERDFALDWRARPFPIDYPAGASGLRVILGVAAAPPVEAGVLDVLGPWPGEDVAAGLGLLGPLLEEPFADQVAGVDVSAYYALGRLAIVTDRGTRVIWGGRYGEFIPGEATTDTKLARLRAAASNPLYQNRIDSGAGQLDIAGEHLILDRTNQP